ncbi:hypothetical protein VTO73DRAFT_2754 [Trametes versicolor]
MDLKQPATSAIFGQCGYKPPSWDDGLRLFSLLSLGHSCAGNVLVPSRSELEESLRACAHATRNQMHSGECLRVNSERAERSVAP